MFLIKRFFLFFPVLFILLVTSCQPEITDEEDDNNSADTVLTGYWKSSFGDGFEVKDGVFTSYADAAKTVTWKGEIIKELTDSKTEGGYVLKVFDSTEEWAPFNDKYIVIRWKDYSITTVKEAAPYHATKEYNGLDTAEQAEKEYTVLNGYYGMYGDYQKQ